MINIHCKCGKLQGFQQEQIRVSRGQQKEGREDTANWGWGS